MSFEASLGTDVQASGFQLLGYGCADHRRPRSLIYRDSF